MKILCIYAKMALVYIELSLCIFTNSLAWVYLAYSDSLKTRREVSNLLAFTQLWPCPFFVSLKAHPLLSACKGTKLQPVPHLWLLQTEGQYCEIWQAPHHYGKELNKIHCQCAKMVKTTVSDRLQFIAWTHLSHLRTKHISVPNANKYNMRMAISPLPVVPRWSSFLPWRPP